MHVWLNATFPMNSLKGSAYWDWAKFSISTFTKLYSRMAAPTIMVANSNVDNNAEIAFLLVSLCVMFCA